ncbi:MAG: NAD(P)/FAD-dependent oxidoreductase [Candidatus Hermodarchaeota archaeon]
MKKDVVIIGGGPAGLAAAEKIAQTGLSVQLLEEHPIIGEPLACGEGISVEKLKLLNIPLSDEFVVRRLVIERFFMGRGALTSHLKTVTVDRPKFDRFLMHRAQEAGAEIMTATSARDLKIDQNEATIKYVASGGISGEIKADVVIGADGAPARMSKAVGLEGPKDFVQAVEVKVQGVHTDGLDFYFDHNLTPKGYGWVFPKATDSNIGIVLAKGKNPKKRLREFLTNLENRYNLPKFEIKQEIAGIIPAANHVPQVYTDRYVVIGDAGGFTNAFFYGGISIGIHTAYLAAQEIKKAFDAENFSAQQLRSYQEQTSKMMYAERSVYETHKIFYDQWNQEHIEAVGKLLDSFDVTKVGQKKKYIIVAKGVLRHPFALWKLRDARKMIRGLKVSRDWGF